MLPQTQQLTIKPMSAEAIEQTMQFEAKMLENEQLPLKTLHVIHAGMYARTVCIPAKTVMTGALIKIATTLIVAGHCALSVGDEVVELHGYCVIPASAGRKQVFYAYTDTYLTMLFTSDAKTVEEAEWQFTDQADMLLSRHMENEIVITGE